LRFLARLLKCLNSKLFNQHASKDHQGKMITCKVKTYQQYASCVLCRFETYQQYASCVCSNEEEESQVTRLVGEEDSRRGRVHQGGYAKVLKEGRELQGQ
jgi:hypothetical protein